jgi:hypothetical protein
MGSSRALVLPLLPADPALGKAKATYAFRDLPNAGQRRRIVLSGKLAM